MKPPAGRRVRSGGFRIDRAKALERLRDFQVQDPAMLVDLWVRAGAASGATRVRVEPVSGGLRVSFDGRPLEKTELEDLWSPLFEDSGPRAERGREIAWGALAALRLNPRQVTIASGAAGGRWKTSLASIGEASTSACREATGMTILEALWGWGWRTQQGRCLERLSSPDRFAMLSCPLDGPAESLEPRGTPAYAFAFRRGHIRGWVAARSPGFHASSLVRVFRHGVVVDTLRPNLPLCVHAWVNDDRLRLTASLGSAAKDERYGALLRILGARSLDLASREVEEQANRFPVLAQSLAEPRGISLWSERSAWQPTGDDIGSSLSRIKETGGAKESLSLLQDAWRADWLHKAAPTLLAESKELAEKLRDTAMYFDSLGGAMTLRELEIEMREHGSIPFTRNRYSGRGRLIWCPTPAEVGWLTTRFGGHAHEADLPV